jgi:hypothetical protein
MRYHGKYGNLCAKMHISGKLFSEAAIQKVLPRLMCSQKLCSRT